jgi:hypothetical protein
MKSALYIDAWMFKVIFPSFMPIKLIQFGYWQLSGYKPVQGSVPSRFAACKAGG